MLLYKEVPAIKDNSESSSSNNRKLSTPSDNKSIYFILNLFYFTIRKIKR